MDDICRKSKGKPNAGTTKMGRFFGGQTGKVKRDAKCIESPQCVDI